MDTEQHGKNLEMLQAVSRNIISIISSSISEEQLESWRINNVYVVCEQFFILCFCLEETGNDVVHFSCFPG